MVVKMDITVNHLIGLRESVILPDAKPVETTMPGWKCDISGVRTWEDLPKEARDYVEYVEREIGCHITYVSVGPERDSIIIR